jgi:NADH dehydrogenase/NADH:ubiquinone oxidoreductase subunit G
MAEQPPRGDLRVGGADPRGLRRGPRITLHVDGVPVVAHAGETIGAAMLAAGIRTTRHTRHAGAPRGMFCGIGACYDCLVQVDGGGPVRACLTPVHDGAEVTT